MNSKLLEDWMIRTGTTAVDIGSFLKIDPGTVKRYLKGHRAHRGNEARYAQLIKLYPNGISHSPGGLKATGS